jgi:hypothetical protein
MVSSTPYQSRARQQDTTKTKTTLSSNSSFNIFLGKPFWIWNKLEHRQEFLRSKPQGTCCFTHVIGLPIKNGRQYPIFDYEKLIFDAIESNRNIWIKKASGIGATELILRYLTWKILVNNNLEHKSIFIVSGTFLSHANDVKVRMENLFRARFPSMQLESKFTDLWIKNTNVKIFPSRNVKDLRGYTDVSYLFIDEADYFEQSVTTELEHAITRYEEKSNCTTIMVSTPNAPGGLFERIEQDKNSKYFKLFLDYTYGLDRIYDREYIARKKLEPEFAREYDLKYLGLIGNIFHTKDIEKAISLGNKYDPNKVIVGSERVLGLDPGFGSSAFGICLVQVANGRIEVLLADDYTRARYEDMVNLIMDLIRGLNRRNIDQDYLDNCKIYIDASNPELISSLKREVGETTRWDYIEERILYCKKHNLDLANYMIVVPVPFNQEGKNMIMHCKELLEYEKPLVAINPKFEKLITAIRTATSSTDDGKLDKERSSYHNVLDAFRSALKGIKLVKKERYR